MSSETALWKWLSIDIFFRICVRYPRGIHSVILCMVQDTLMSARDFIGQIKCTQNGEAMFVRLVFICNGLFQDPLRNVDNICVALNSGVPKGGFGGFKRPREK
jgi:hypothetical protein